MKNELTEVERETLEVIEAAGTPKANRIRKALNIKPSALNQRLQGLKRKGYVAMTTFGVWGLTTEGREALTGNHYEN